MVIVHSLSTSKLENESDRDYLQRLCSIKDDLNITWKELAEIANNELNYTFSDSWYRKRFNKGDFSSVLDTLVTCTASTEDTFNSCSCDKSEVDEILELKKQKIKLSEERIQANAYIRRLSREETIKDIAHNYAKEMASAYTYPLIDYPQQSCNTDDPKEAILLLSDWHYGMVCDNPWNKFDPSVCKERVSKLLSKVIKRVAEQNIYKITVMNLSDLIAGRIHTQIRIESRFDVITQTMDVAEILSNFLFELSKHCFIDYYDCLDNHSRLEPNKKESLDLESLVRIIPWYLKERLATNQNIKICDNEFGADIITCNVMGHNVIAVHGDNDKPVYALERLSLMTHRHYDMLCTAHLHHFSADEKNQSIVISNSSLMGTDSYAEKLRLSSDPSQTLIIVTPENVCDCVYRIVLR